MILDMYARSSDEFVRSQAALVSRCPPLGRLTLQLTAPSPAASPLQPTTAAPVNGHADAKPGPAQAPPAVAPHPTEEFFDVHPTEALLSPKRPASPPRPADVAPSPRPGSTAPGEETATQREERLRVEVGDAKDAVLRSTS